MPELKNPQHEAFARGVATLGMSGAAAVRHAKFDTMNPRQRAFRLLAREEVKARIAELEAEREADRERMKAATAPDADAAGHEAGSLEWLVAEHRRNLAISKARADTREARATLVELGKLAGFYVERSEVTTKADPLTAMSAAEIEALRSWIGQRLAAPQPAVTITAEAVVVRPDAPDA